MEVWVLRTILFGLRDWEISAIFLHFLRCSHFVPVPSSPTFFFLYVHRLVTSSQWRFGISDKKFLQHMKETELVAPGGRKTVAAWFSLPPPTYGTCKIIVLKFVFLWSAQSLVSPSMLPNVQRHDGRATMAEPPETVAYLHHKYCIPSHHQYIGVSIPI